MRNLILYPIRFCVGWGLSPRLLGLIGAAMLVLLRIAIGWHFYSEGVEKYKSGDWTAAPFFANANGPFAEHYRSMVWDHDGTIRRDLDQSMLQLAVFRDQVASHYGFDAKQAGRAQQNYSDAVAQQKQVLIDNAQDLAEYDLGAARLEKMNQDPSRSGVSSLRGQKETIRKERLDLIQPTLSAIDKVWENYVTAQNSVATQEQKLSSGMIEMHKPLGLNTGTIDRFVPYFDIAIGVCLLLGLFTPLAALAAAGFLGSVFLSQYPPGTGPTSSMYQLIECMGCLVLAGTAAGRFAGLDYFLHLIFVRSFFGLPDRRSESRR